MPGLPLAVLTVTIRLVEVTGVSDVDAEHLAGMIGRAIEARTSAQVTLLAREHAVPDRDNGATLDLSIDAGLTKLQLLAERSGPGQDHASVEMTGPVELAAWQDRVADLATRLFPDRITPRASPSLPQPDVTGSPPSRSATGERTLIPHVLFAAGVVSGAVALGLAVSGSAASDTLDRGGLFEPAEFNALRDRASAHRTAASALAITSLVFLAGATVAALSGF